MLRFIYSSNILRSDRFKLTFAKNLISIIYLLEFEIIDVPNIVAFISISFYQWIDRFILICILIAQVFFIKGNDNILYSYIFHVCRVNMLC